MLLLRTLDVEAARREFLNLRQELKAKDDETSRYIRRYAQNFLAMIRCDSHQMGHEQAEAAKIDCHPRLKRILWMPNGRREDPFDAEFDAWMKANYPEDDDV